MNAEKFSKFIISRRKKLGYTQEQLGEALNVSPQAVSKWERGLSFPDITMLDDLSIVLKCSHHDLITGTQRMDNDNTSKINNRSHTVGTTVQENKVSTSKIPARYVSEFLFGNNLEHTRNSVHQGISAQMLENRKFVGKPCVKGCALGWNPVGEGAFFGFGKPYTRHDEDYHMKRSRECNSQVVTSFVDGRESGICQSGLCIEKDKKYVFLIAIKANYDCKLKITLAKKGGDILCCDTINVKKSAEYDEKELVLTSIGDCDDAEISITFDEANTIYIGAVSLMPAENFHGMRNDVIELMKEMGISVLRWPGGNFAGEYNWKDGLMSSNMRAPFESALSIETQPLTMGYDFHEINTDDFIMLCREIGAEPFVTINPTWNTPEMSAQWVEYCNGDETTEYGKIRISRGYKEPYNVKFWSLGNEFGYGHMEGPSGPYEYSKMVRSHATAMLKVTPDLNLCSSGPYPDADWAAHSAVPLEDIAKYVSLHHYVNYPEFSNKENYREEYEKFIKGTSVIKELSHKLRKMLGDKKLRISFDEWNSWYAWYRPQSVCDGIFAAKVLQTFINNADELGIGLVCHFEAVNEGAIIVKPKDAKLTPMGEAIAMMQHHKSGKILFSDDNVITTEHKGKIITTLINDSYDEEREYNIPFYSGDVSGTLYYSEHILPHSEFLKKDIEFSKNDSDYVINMPPHSIALFIQK